VVVNLRNPTCVWRFVASPRAGAVLAAFLMEAAGSSGTTTPAISYTKICPLRRAVGLIQWRSCRCVTDSVQQRTEDAFRLAANNRLRYSDF
jgi:hypothetical protein